jgi:hypothetical protein
MTIELLFHTWKQHKQIEMAGEARHSALRRPNVTDDIDKQRRGNNRAYQVVCNATMKQHHSKWRVISSASEEMPGTVAAMFLYYSAQALRKGESSHESCSYP